MNIMTLTPIVPAGRPFQIPLASGNPQLSIDSGWTAVARPKNTAFLDWQGTGLMQQMSQCIFDGFADDRSIEPELNRLVLLTRTKMTTGMPAILRVDGAVPLSGRACVIGGVQFGEELWHPEGYRTRSIFTLTLVEYVSAEFLRVSAAVSVTSPAAEAASAAANTPESAATPATGQTYTVRAGDTLWGIAQRVLGKGSRWPEIAKLNNLRDPNNVKVGTVLRIP